jgi:hypothetical protein
MRFTKLAAVFLFGSVLLAIASIAADPSAKPKDPVALNGPIFENWPTPQAVIIISGQLDGYMEPCGCAGLENQKGGLKRRFTFIKDLQKKNWPVAAFDVGGLVKYTGEQSAIKYRFELESLVEMGYAAVALGLNDLQLNADAVSFAITNLDKQKNPVVSANAGIYGIDESVELGLNQRYRVINAGGKKIGVTAVLGSKSLQSLKNISDVAVIDPVEGLTAVAPKLAAEKCDLQVLLVQGDLKEAAALGQKFPQFNIVAASVGAEEPPQRPKTIEGTHNLLVEPGHKGEYLIALGIYDDPKQPIRYQSVPLDSRFADAPEMQTKMVAYQHELESKGLKGLGLSGSSHPEGDFAGSAACKDCHSQAWAVYEKTPHFHATETLMKKTSPPRLHDPECLACHVTGWNPQEYFPYKTGYTSLKDTPDLVGNGCENCHGPAADHVKVESGELTVTPAQQQEILARLRLKIAPNEGNKTGQEFAKGQVVNMCMKCHDLDNSPDFDFQKYWPKVKHAGKD